MCICSKLWIWHFSVWRYHGVPCCCSLEKHTIVLSRSSIPLHADSHSHCWKSILWGILWLRFTCWILSLCLSSSGNFMSFPALSWQSCDCHGDLPVTVPQEATALDYDVKGWTLCTLEPEGRSICRVCIISIKEKKNKSCSFLFMWCNKSVCIWVITLP